MLLSPARILPKLGGGGAGPGPFSESAAGTEETGAGLGPISVTLLDGIVKGVCVFINW